MKQCMIYDKANNVSHGGILLDNGDVICGCCGGLIPADEIGGEKNDTVILKVFEHWIDLTAEICGDDLFDDRFEDALRR